MKILSFSLTLFIISGLTGSSLGESNEAIVDVDEYWPEVAHDLSLVTWAHAANSKELLDAAIDDEDVMMIEADVLMGRLKGSALDEPLIPIMAHPPQKLSDLSVEMFISTVVDAVNATTKKGIKLDFKELAAVGPSLDIVTSMELNFPVWLNADILPGPVNATSVPLEPTQFINVTNEYLPQATLSVGWTTRYTTSDDPLAKYTEQDILNMKEVLDTRETVQPVTFPVRAAFVKNSLVTLPQLVDSVNDSSLTVWSSASDDVDIPSLITLQDTVGPDKVYFDLPEEQKTEFDNLHRQMRSEATPTLRLWPRHSIFFANVSVVLLASAFYCFYHNL